MIAAQSIGEPGIQLTMRTFHVGGAASRAAVASQVETKSAGMVRFTASMRYVTSAKGEKIVITRSGEVLITDENGREREKHKVPYGSTLQVADGQQAKAGTKLATWDPHTRPIIAEYSGLVKFENVEEGVTVAKQIDEVTGLSTLVVIDPKRGGKAQTKGLRPQIKLFDAAGDEVKMHGSDHAVNITFQVGAIITVLDGQQISVGDVLARLPQESAKTRDITGGLLRVAELFEARTPKDAGMLAEYTGTMSFGKDTKGKQRLVITDLDGVSHEYLIPKDKHVLVHDGQVRTRVSRLSMVRPIRTIFFVCRVSRLLPSTSLTKCRMSIVCRALRSMTSISRSLFARCCAELMCLTPGTPSLSKANRSSAHTCLMRTTACLSRANLRPAMNLSF